MPEQELSVELCTGETLRLDRYLAGIAGFLTRSQLKARNAAAQLNGKPVKLSAPVHAGDRIRLHWEDAPLHHLVPEQLPLDILYEDERIIVINKPQGMVTHPAAGNWSGTLVNALLGLYTARHAGKALPAAHPRPFIAHRLDKDTSGVIIAAWEPDALEWLQAQFRSRAVRKTYLAFCRGRPPEDEGCINANLVRDSAERKRFTVSPTRGKAALTRYRVLTSYTQNGTEYTLFMLHPQTGRTHQLRVHLKHLGCPILGDPLYAARDKNFPGAPLMLHARRLVITLPGQKTPTPFAAPLPGHLRHLLASMKHRQIRDFTKR